MRLRELSLIFARENLKPQFWREFDAFLTQPPKARAKELHQVIKAAFWRSSFAQFDSISANEVRSDSEQLSCSNQTRDALCLPFVFWRQNVSRRAHTSGARFEARRFVAHLCITQSIIELALERRPKSAHKRKTSAFLLCCVFVSACELRKSLQRRAV